MISSELQRSVGVGGKPTGRVAECSRQIDDAVHPEVSLSCNTTKAQAIASWPAP